MADYALYILLRIIIFCMRFLPLKIWLMLGRGIGRLYYYVAGKKNRVALANLKIAFPEKTRKEQKRIIKQMYQCFAQNLIEALYVPYVDAATLKKYISVPDRAVVDRAIEANAGVIFLACHEGSWELSQMTCALLFSAQGKIQYAMMAKPQKDCKKLDAFLNQMRRSKGVDVIGVAELKKMVAHLSQGNMLGVVADHGGRDGVAVSFFGKLAMTPVGGVRLANKLGSKIILAYMRRVRGPHHEMYFKEYQPVTTADAAHDMKVNLTRINKVFESWITQYPQEYLWFFKRWKYTPQKHVLVLSDGKLGHLKQSLACVDMIRGLGFTVRSDVVLLAYRLPFLKKFLSLAGLLLGRRATRALLPLFLTTDSCQQLTNHQQDIVVSTGSSLAAVNGALSWENNARSITIMKPGILPWNRFDAVIIPEHDQPRPQKNVFITAGSLNTVSVATMKSDFEKLVLVFPELARIVFEQKPKIGVLIGGNSKHYTLTSEHADLLCQQLKKVLNDVDGYLFLTTSRRTPPEVIGVLKKYFNHDARVKLLVVASEDNPPGTVGGIFYVCDVVVVSGESISMVSESVATGKYVVVFEPDVKYADNKVKRFLTFLAAKKYIYLLKVNEIYGKLSWLISSRPEHHTLDSKGEVVEGLKKIIR